MSTQKTYTADIKADTNGKPGGFTALVSVFGNVDHMGDRVMPGAFKESLANWSKSGDPVPLIFSHEWSDPFKHIGIADPKDIKETSEGLVLKGQLDIEDNPVAAQVHKLMQRRSLKEFSFSYDIQDEGPGKDKANELRKISLIEAGPTLKGANPETQLLAVKAMAADLEEKLALKTDWTHGKAGARISKSDADRWAIHLNGISLELDAAFQFLSSLKGETPPESDTDAKTDEPEAKVEERPNIVAIREAIAVVEAAGGKNHGS